MKKIVAFILFFLMISCAGLSDFINDLGEGYFYYGEGAPANHIHYKDKKNDQGIEKIIVPSNVSHYNYNKDYIIVIQNPSYEWIKIDLEFFKDISEQKADSILKNDPYYKKLFSRTINYWIISKKDHQVYGPLSKKEYQTQRKELGVSENLVLEE